MMRPILTGLVMLTASSFAMASDTGPGCGWGSMLFKGQSGVASHVVAATTNGTSGNNTFGMTSGTNGCDTSRTINYTGSNAVVFHNMDRLSNDIAKGDGEVLSTVASVMGVEARDVPTFKRVMHDNFNTLYPNSDVTSEQIVQTMVSLMANDETLAKYV
ncbi:DUF3015 domain-containing protein [Porticoccus sp.]|uniref:DUF3015 domain-containing protein n=1 Tax=Porticoccus sp. TaxID=2024853 RepID=UPI0025FD2EF5|nr:DUF3015 domain-containing protein [Porticoccus sp.]